MTTETRSWQDCLVDTILEELALGMSVAIQLPGLPGPMLVEDAVVEGALVLLSDQPGTRHYIGSMAGVVLLAAPLEGKGTGTWRPHAWTPTMTLDGKRPDIRSIRPVPGSHDV
jgi:hypothetical protein